MKTLFALAPLAAALACISFAANAQQPAPIERVRITDNQLSCAQMHGELGDMDKHIAAAREAESSGNSTAMAGTAANVAAEVAGRTGLFGQLGGVAGALFGQVATQTAAGAAKQSGQQTAQQSAERAKQAAARKEHLTTMFVARGCNPSDLNFNPAVTEASTAAMQTALQAAQPKAIDPAAVKAMFAPAASFTALPGLDPDAHFKGQMGGTFGKNVVDVMPNSKRVAVAGFRVAFITENTAKATVRASYFLGRDTSGASSTLNLKLNGVDYATLQAITDKAYADFVGQLKFAGREVVPPEELKEFHAGVDVSSAPGKPYTKSVNDQTAVILAPAGMPLFFTNWDGHWGDKGPFDQKNTRSLGEYSAKLKAIVINPLIVVNFAQMSSSGNRSGMLARSAETGAALAMHVASFSSNWVRADTTHNGLVSGGDEGAVSMHAPIISKMEFGTMKEVGATDNSATKGVFDSLGKSMGMLNAGGAARSKTENMADTNNPAYGAAALDALGSATGTFAKWFQKYPAR